jgi:predicted GIY-YIG superfamily endonuclease
MNKKVIRNLEKHTKQLSKIGLTINSLLESDEKYYYEIQTKDINVICKTDDLDAISDNKQMLMLYAILKYLSNKYEDNVITIDNDYAESLLGVTSGILIDIKNDLSKTDVVKIDGDTYTVLDNVEFESDYTVYNVSEKYYVYRFINKEGDIIYVGRTQNLHNRMNQHFGSKGHLPKQAYDEVNRIEYTILDSEIKMVMCEIYEINKFNSKYNTKDLYRGEIYLEQFEDENLQWKIYDNQ